MFSLHTAVCGPAGLAELKARRVFLVTDPFFAGNGTAERLARTAGAQHRIFDGVKPDPDLRCLAAGLGALRDFDPDLLLALGGGSAMDCAKGLLALWDKRPTFVAVPTTSGTGSEVTSFTVLTHAGVKHPIVDPRLRPDIAILDDSLLAGLPAGLVAEAGMDALSHCAEAVAAKGASGFSTALATGAFRTLLTLLPRSYAGEAAVRGAIHEAATMAGAAFDQAGLGACHALAHAVGGRFHVAHGKLGGIFLPHVLRFNAQTHPEPYEALAAACGLHGLGGLLAALQRLRRQLKLPATLSQAGLSRMDVISVLDDLAAAAAADPCAGGNPRPLEAREARDLLRSAL
ncbi:MAG: iron-containing alcohol dehydrogenase [Oscillospiraceae bacterium]|nr:iron-containing alcohol dehydrogenase [Oscillospiraceae bacterium]